MYSIRGQGQIWGHFQKQIVFLDHALPIRLRSVWDGVRGLRIQRRAIRPCGVQRDQIDAQGSTWQVKKNLFIVSTSFPLRKLHFDNPFRHLNNTSVTKHWQWWRSSCLLTTLLEQKRPSKRTLRQICVKYLKTIKKSDKHTTLLHLLSYSLFSRSFASGTTNFLSPEEIIDQAWQRLRNRPGF